MSIAVVNAEQFIIQTATPRYINQTINTLVNFTLNNTGNFNITQVQIQLPFGFNLLANSNGTTVASNSVNFSNASVFGVTTLTWTNVSSTALIQNVSDGVTRVSGFWFNVTNLLPGDYQFTVLTNDTAIFGNLSQTTLTTNFAFMGFVKNETGNADNVNVTVYQYILSTGVPGPPTERIASSTLSAADGSFNVPSINGSATLYTLKLIHYNSNNLADKVGSALPAFPAMMFFPMNLGPVPQFEFMKPPTLNGTTFYVQPAATLRLAATNGSNVQTFGYEVVDQKLGFPIESNIQETVTTKDIVVPTGGTYTAMFVRMPNFGGLGSGFTFDGTICDGRFMNSTHCPTPPISNASFGTLTEGQLLVINQSLVTSIYRLTGCIDVQQNNNNTAVNITNIAPRIVPWPGFVLPIKADVGNINIANDVNYSKQPECSFAFYNISVMGAAGGVNYLLEFYAKNTSASNEAGTPGSSAWQLAAFQNTTVTGNTNLNVTLRRLTGSYWTEGLGSVNTSTIRINIQNSTGGAITTNMHLEVSVKNPAFGIMHYIIESVSNGTFYLPILNNSNWAKIKVFANDAPPKELTINLSTNQTNIKLTTMSDGKGAGFKKVNITGQLDIIDSTSLGETIPIQMRFLRNSNACNTLEPDSSCEITTMTARNFNPFKALVAGKVNMEMKVTSTNVTMMFMNFDMFAAKQPPMDSVLNSNASSSSSASQTWEFGSFAPSNTYDYVVIGMPYSDRVSASNFLNDSFPFSLSIPLLYDENWNAVWNRSRGDTSANLPDDDFLDYNSTLYVDYLSSGGVACSKTNNTLLSVPCYMNTTSNILWMRIPHFSGISPSSSGTAPATTAATTTTTASGGTGSGGGAVQISYTLPELKAGVEQTLSFDNPQLGVESILLTTARTLSDVKVTLLEHKEQPSGTNPPPFSAYKYFEVTPTNLVASDITTSRIIFTVTQEWLTSKQGLPKQIALYKYKDGWAKLPTKDLGEAGTLHKFQADTNGFSFFAVGLESAPQPTPPTTEITPSAPSSTPPSLGRKIFSAKSTLFAILGAIVVLIILYFLIKEYRGKKH